MEGTIEGRSVDLGSQEQTAKMEGTFEVDMTKYKEVELDPWTEETLPAAKKAQLLQNIEVCRDAVVFFTACGSASGYGGTRACMHVTRKQQGPL